MSHAAWVPFQLRRSSDSWKATSYTSTTETVHGVARLGPDRLVVQWRLSRQIQRMGSLSVDTSEEVEPVREVTVPLEKIADAVVRPPRWWRFWTGPQLVLTATDLTAFEEVARAGGLSLEHPGELVLRVRRRDRLAAEELAAEVSLALVRLDDGDAGRPDRMISEGPHAP